MGGISAAQRGLPLEWGTLSQGYAATSEGSFFLWLAFGNLNNGTGNGGLSYLNGNNTLGNANWNILARQSGKRPGVVPCPGMFTRCIVLSAEKIDEETTGRVKQTRENPDIVQKEGNSLHRSCKNINLCDTETVLPFVRKCVMRHVRRHDFRDLLCAFGMSRRIYAEATAQKRHTGKALSPEIFEPYIRNIAKEAAARIRRRELKLAPVKIRVRIDKTTGKVRPIGKESAFQQVFDHIAVGASQEIWARRIVPQQASSIEGRGQIYGMKMIRGWVMADNRSIKWAEKHGVRYTSKCKYFAKLDVTKCYPNARAERFLALFEKDCGNPDLLWLWKTLLETHKVNGYEGFLIGALPSQWAAQYMMSFVYNEAMRLNRERRGKRVRLVSHAAAYMDDVLLMGSSRSGLKQAIRHIVGYARDTIGFTIKPTWNIYELEATGVDMMGFVVHRSGKVTIRGRDFVRARRMAIRCERQRGLSYRQAKRVTSYKGYFKFSDGRKAKQAYALGNVFSTASRVISQKERGKK